MKKDSGRTSQDIYRFYILASFMVVVFLLYLLRLFVLQVQSFAYYTALASEQYSTKKILQPSRGEIKVADRNSLDLFTVAAVTKKKLAFVDAQEVVDQNLVARTLKEVLEVDEGEVLERILDRSRRYIVIKKQISDDQAKALQDRNVIGIHFDEESVRVYPENSFLSHVLGFVGYKGDIRQGLYGIEESQEGELRGESGSLDQEKDVHGTWILSGRREIKPVKDGDTLVLTVDRSIQLKAEQILRETVDSNEADSGSIVAMNPKTGAILAMANYPDFNPNEYNKVEDPSVFVNDATLSNYEPGSIFKPLTMAAAINEGKVTQDTTYIDTGSVEIDGYKIQNSDKEAHGRQTMTQVLEESLNTGAIFAKESIGNQMFFDYVKKFGFGAATGIELRESKGDLDNLKANIKVNFHTASFGQGIAVTPIQMVQAYGALANKGVLMRPFIIQSRITSDGTTFTTRPTEVGKVISEQTASLVSGMLVNVVEKGHGKRAQVAGFWVAGKTGTAQVPKKDGRGYDETNNIGSFIGYAPVENPQFVALVRVNHPRNVRFAESTAAPAFGELAKYILSYLNVLPTRQIAK